MKAARHYKQIAGAAAHLHFGDTSFQSEIASPSLEAPFAAALSRTSFTCTSTIDANPQSTLIDVELDLCAKRTPRTKQSHQTETTLIIKIKGSVVTDNNTSALKSIST